jgi:hypothetical protein
MLKPAFLGRLRPRSGYDVVAVIAMCAALGTGGAYAAATIGTDEVVDESLTDADIKNGSLGAAIADGSITKSKLAPWSVWGGQAGTILDDSVTGDDVNEATLGKVQKAAMADQANVAQTAFKAGYAPIDGYKIVSTKAVSGSGQHREGEVSCPLGSKVLGGTYRMSDPQLWYGSTDRAPDRVMTKIVDDGNTFRVGADDELLEDTPAHDPLYLYIQATCAKVG